MEESAFVPYESSLPKGERFTVLVPHPDDEVLGAGGTLALLAEKGKQVQVHILTEGEEQGEPGTRRKESAEACRILGLESVHFHNLKDRGLKECDSKIRILLGKILEDEDPDVLMFPGPHESHPDHRALAASIIGYFHQIRPADPEYGRFRDLKLVFLEISLPQRINHLVDITEVVARKREALEKFVSQQAVRDYAEKMMGLNAYRSTTLPPPATHAEGFKVIDAGHLLLHPLSSFISDDGPLPGEADSGTLSLIIRTRNRPNLLREALDSVAAASRGPDQILVVNDGGEEIGAVVDDFSGLPLAVVDLKEQVGRGAAANAGLERATGDLVAFLDDDDIVYSEHFSTLRSAIAAANTGVVYSDAVSTLCGWDDEGKSVQLDRLLAYSHDFDADLLLYDNYIPFHTVLFRRELLKQSGRVREDLDIFEDWEFLVRLSRVTPFHHIRRVTCAYRHFSEGATLGRDPASNPEFIEGRKRVLELTGDLRSLKVEERIVRKLRMELERTKGEHDNLLGELRGHRQQSGDLSREVHRLGTDLGRVTDAFDRTQQEHARAAKESAGRIEQLENTLGEKSHWVEKLEGELKQVNDHLGATFGEIERLNSILGQIYSSRTWRLHSMIQKMRKREG